MDCRKIIDALNAERDVLRQQWFILRARNAAFARAEAAIGRLSEIMAMDDQQLYESYTAAQHLRRQKRQEKRRPGLIETEK